MIKCVNRYNKLRVWIVLNFNFLKILKTTKTLAMTRFGEVLLWQRYKIVRSA